MTTLTAILLGILQGLTEFLPVSSSGHLVIAQRILGSRASVSLVFEVMLHVGTLLAVLIYFRRRLWDLVRSWFVGKDENSGVWRRYCLMTVVGTAPAVVAAIAGGREVEVVFNSPHVAAVLLVVNGAILLATGAVRRGNFSVDLWRALVIGLAQAIALLPGISRSGMTISAGLVLKVSPREAAEFSFLLSVPAILGALILKTAQLLAGDIGYADLGRYTLGTFFAFVVGYISIASLLRVVQKGKFFYFGIYCVVIGALGVLFL